MIYCHIEGKINDFIFILFYLIIYFACFVNKFFLECRGRQSDHRGCASSVKLHFSRNSFLFRASELALPQNSECLGMSTFFRRITETVLILFRGIFSERNSVPNPMYICLSVPLSACSPALLPSCLPSFPPACMPVFLPACLPAPCLPACRLTWLLPCLPV